MTTAMKGSTNIDKKNAIYGTPIVNGMRSTTTAKTPLPSAVNHKERIEEKTPLTMTIESENDLRAPVLPRLKPRTFTSRTQHESRRSKQ
jgi:hypothetical protein